MQKKTAKIKIKNYAPSNKNYKKIIYAEVCGSYAVKK